ncbi:ketopantoate reductase PanE/ApbA-like protein [Thermodesulfitimonas autotrophica]|uniref:Ketopantoate reductase PanE/ApbA-like protein n=1 Tax=Thermodesulfitimonas autotrophica TaxID=1894989 RepID=A0A3N5AXG9_9THEO|nr:2-dehydropantoate 2-reductase N-terminal domain-containing protein [Thermodesulfitimonas autotrophica]RPF49637.1 ketopantoate reductase PanE/ApbA-like protein [Thermodesulfitimonas autotrophica]
MRVLVIGAGALGSVFGGYLSLAGEEVTLLGRPWHLEAVARQGLFIEGIWGEENRNRRVERPDCGVRRCVRHSDPL